MLERLLNLPELMQRKSYFLFGPRATGKSTLIKHSFPKTVAVINLLRSEMYLRLTTNPEELESIIAAYPDQSIAIIDEVQRIPELLNEVHRLIEDKGIKFLLTGSSGRKLKQANVNLLGGRARTASLFPLTSREIPDFNLQRYLRYGGLPPVYLSDEPDEDLYAYADTYLKEEIINEALVRKIPAFSRFLKVAALTSGDMLNFTEVSNDTGVPVSTIRAYYQILEDTFIGFLVPGWNKTVKRKAFSTAKFYFFDIGVKNILAEIKNIEPKSNLYGQSFEHFIALEIRAYLSYHRIRSKLCYWCSKNGFEVDFIIGDEIAIEVKTTQKTADKHLKGLKMLSEEKICKRYILVSHDKINRKAGELEMLFWRDFLDQLWAGKII